jgi:ABC-type branched-subunit amino acid transport system substrate-binding protein
VFNFRAGYALETAALVDHFCGRERLDPTRLAVLAQDDGYGASGIDGIRRALAARGFRDFDRVTITHYPANTMDVRRAVELVAARADVELVILIAAYRAAAQFVSSLAHLRPAITYAGVSPTGSSVFVDELVRLGHDPTGVVLTQIVPHPSSAANGVLRYREALARHAPDAAPGFVSLEGYVVGDLVVEALRRCEGDRSRETLVDTLETFRDVDLGFGTPITFSASDHQGSERVWGTRVDADGQLAAFALG